MAKTCCWGATSVVGENLLKKNKKLYNMDLVFGRMNTK